MENLDYVLQRMEERTPDNFATSQFGSNPYGTMPGTLGSRGRSNTLSSRALLESYKDKPDAHCNCCTCKVMAAFVIIALLAWGVAVPVYFLIGPGSGPRSVEDLPNAIVQAQRAPFEANASFLNGTVLNAINGTIRIVNQRFTPNLANHFSAEYQALKLKLETLLSVVFNKKSDFNRAAVIGFRPGSVVVQFVLIFNKNQLLVRHLVQITLARYLGTHWSMLGTFQVDIGSIDIRNVRNQCAVDNGGCSHLCFWSILSDGYECRCPQDYRLLSDHKSCFPEKLPKATTTSNPCADDQFLCRSRNCIPNRWLCDGVSDCLLGEDEANHICHAPIRGRLAAVVNVTASHRPPSRHAPTATDRHTDRHRQPFVKPPAHPAPLAKKTPVTREQAPPTSRSLPLVAQQRKPVEVIGDLKTPSLVAQQKVEDRFKPRSFSFFG